MRILFLDQSGELGGAELCLKDVALAWRESCLVALFGDGAFRVLLEQHNIQTCVLATKAIKVRKESSFLAGIKSLTHLIPLILITASLSKKYDLIYANTQKALVVGAIASFIARRPLVYHLHDILTTEHFSIFNLKIAVSLANWFSSLIIANSEATKSAFKFAGGKEELVSIVYNGFNLEKFYNLKVDAELVREQLGIKNSFVVGHFSRLSPWKAQHILIKALAYCPDDVTVLLVGDALFGEQDYVVQLRSLTLTLGLQHRVHFLGFRHDTPELMSSCDLIAHTSTLPEPFGRVIVEAMLCQKPVVASAAGGAIELIEHGETGWLFPIGNYKELAKIITACVNNKDLNATVALQSRTKAMQYYDIQHTNEQIKQLLEAFRL